MTRGISWRNVERTLLVWVVVLLGFCLGISGAAAHSRLVKSDPSARAVLQTVPKELKLWFNEGVEPAFAKVWIIPAQGAQIPLTSHGDSSNPRLLIVAFPGNLPAGPVNIGYHMLSIDGHVVDAELTFTVKAP